jgi:DNA polymerase I-like protein with 3'-5' exonuclease and polymerase domains
VKSGWQKLHHATWLTVRPGTGGEFTKRSSSRNAPSNSKFIFGPSKWLRSLIKPPPGKAVAYIDWEQQELAIAAALSGDPVMQEMYGSGDFYMAFARSIGAAPPDATGETHADVRETFKIVSLGVLYGLSDRGIAAKLGVQPCRGRELLQLHKQTFKQFWIWSDAVEVQAALTGQLHTVFGWTVHVGDEVNPRSMRNFPMQANGAEMMRLACCLATERGIQVCAPIHDALLVEADSDAIEVVVAETQAIMEEASRIVLDGFSLRTEVKIVRHPQRFLDKRGVGMWKVVTGLLRGHRTGKAAG